MMMAETDTDADLLPRLIGGDRHAFELMMRRHNRRLYRLARATLRNDCDAEDALQEAYLAAYHSLAGFRGDAALSTWLSRLVMNECLGRLRRSKRREQIAPTDGGDALDVHALSAHEPEHALARAQLRRLIEQRLDRLPDDYRTVFVLRSVEEMSVEETAAWLDISPEAVRTRHLRARSLLRGALERELGDAAREMFGFGGDHCDRIVAAVLARIAAR